MAKDGYVFYCSRCKFDHAGECAQDKPETDKASDGPQWCTIPFSGTWPVGIGAGLPKDFQIKIIPPDKP